MRNYYDLFVLSSFLRDMGYEMWDLGCENCDIMMVLPMQLFFRPHRGIVDQTVEAGND